MYNINITISDNIYIYIYIYIVKNDISIKELTESMPSDLG